MSLTKMQAFELRRTRRRHNGLLVAVKDLSAEQVQLVDLGLVARADARRPGHVKLTLTPQGNQEVERLMAVS